jgi:hypothetical protein
MLQMRTAAGGVADDGVKLLRRKLINALAGQLPGQLQFAVVRVQGAAAMLPGRRDDFAAVAGQDFRRVAVDIAEHQILRAAGQQGHAVFLLACGGHHGGIKAEENFGWITGVIASNSSQAARQQLEDAERRSKRCSPIADKGG